MSGPEMNVSDEQRQQARAVLVKYGLRWAVMAAWHEDLVGRSVALPRSVSGQLEGARIKIASGCFTPCEVGCDLGGIEGDMTSADASTADGRTDYWIGLLGRAMSEDVRAEEILRIPAVKFMFNDCQLRGCACARG